jgi:hypothetical protein
VRPVRELIGYILLVAFWRASRSQFSHTSLRCRRGCSLLILRYHPSVVGVAMVRLGQWLAQRGQQAILLHKFWFGFAFALVFALVRFGFAA